jgi:hypothetical protein
MVSAFQAYNLSINERKTERKFEPTMQTPAEYKAKNPHKL